MKNRYEIVNVNGVNYSAWTMSKKQFTAMNYQYDLRAALLGSATLEGLEKPGELFEYVDIFTDEVNYIFAI